MRACPYHARMKGNEKCMSLELSYELVWATSHTSQEPWPWTCESPKRKCSKAVPTHLQNHVVWSRVPKCSVKSYVSGPSTKCYFDEFLFMRVFTLDKNGINQRLWAFRVPWSPGFVFHQPPESGFWKCYPCTHPRRLYIHLAFTYILTWSLKRSVKRTWTGFCRRILQ